jgi:hypothetical protein
MAVTLLAIAHIMHSVVTLSLIIQMREMRMRLKTSPIQPAKRSHSDGR